MHNSANIWGLLTFSGVVLHSTSEDDIHEGYYIPKGTTVIPNIWYGILSQKFAPISDYIVR